MRVYQTLALTGLGDTPLLKMVGSAGLEPATKGLVGLHGLEP